MKQHTVEAVINPHNSLADSPSPPKGQRTHSSPPLTSHFITFIDWNICFGRLDARCSLSGVSTITSLTNTTWILVLEETSDPVPKNPTKKRQKWKKKGEDSNCYRCLLTAPCAINRSSSRGTSNTQTPPHLCNPHHTPHAALCGLERLSRYSGGLLASLVVGDRIMLQVTGSAVNKDYWLYLDAELDPTKTFTVSKINVLDCVSTFWRKVNIDWRLQFCAYILLPSIFCLLSLIYNSASNLRRADAIGAPRNVTACRGDADCSNCDWSD